MSVREHKTGSEGYINHIGPLIDPQHKIDRLFSHQWSQEADERAQLHPGSRKKHGFSAPSSTKVRKIDQQLCGCSVGRLKLISSPDNCLTQYTHTGLTS